MPASCVQRAMASRSATSRWPSRPPHQRRSKASGARQLLRVAAGEVQADLRLSIAKRQRTAQTARRPVGGSSGNRRAHDRPGDQIPVSCCAAVSSCAAWSARGRGSWRHRRNRPSDSGEVGRFSGGGSSVGGRRQLQERDPRETAAHPRLEGAERIERNAGIGMMGVVLHDVVGQRMKRLGQSRVNGHRNAGVEPLPNRRVLEPGNLGMGVMCVDHEPHQPVPDEEGEEPAEAEGGPERPVWCEQAAAPGDGGDQGRLRQQDEGAVEDMPAPVPARLRRDGQEVFLPPHLDQIIGEGAQWAPIEPIDPAPQQRGAPGTRRATSAPTHSPAP